MTSRSRANKLERASRFLSLTLLADMMGTTRPYLSMLLNNNKKLTPEMESKLRKAVRRIIKELERI